MTSEWRTLENLHLLLKPFAQYTSLVSGKEYTTIPSDEYGQPSLRGNEKGAGIDSCVNTFAVRAETEVQRYTDSAVPNHEPVFLVSTLLDPQSKLLLNPTQTNSAKTKLLCLLKAGKEGIKAGR